MMMFRVVGIFLCISHAQAACAGNVGTCNVTSRDSALLQRASYLQVSKDQKLPAPSCVAEGVLRRMLKSVVRANVIRGVFHDAVDQDNLLLKNHTSGKWVAIKGSYGGVDGCMYSPLTEGTSGTPNPDHNRNIQNGFRWAKRLCAKICSYSWPQGLRGTSLCKRATDCSVDLTVLGSLMTIQNAGGPVVRMSWGRTKGPCKGSMIVTPFTKNTDKLKEYENKPALNSAPSLTGIDDPQQYRTAFAKWGFDPTDQVALMGAHSFGHIEVCAGGLNGIEKGPFCYRKEYVNVTMADGSAWRKPHNNWGDGGLWDRTPTKFDNDYFKLFEDETFEHKDDCCGKIKKGYCHRGGTMVTITRRDATGRGVKGKRIPNGPCSVSWCRSDRKGRTHMKSTKVWEQVNPQWPGFGKARKHGTQRRMIRLAADWALLADPVLKAKVKQFANDEPAFFAAFAVAWEKVINKTHSPLSLCIGGEASDADIDQAYKILQCQDKHRKCPKAKCWKKNWARRCPRKCQRCPDQQP